MVQSKKMKLSKDPVQMAKIVDEVLMLTSCAVDKAGRSIQKPTVKLTKKVPNDLPIIEADAHRCTQMLYNLVTNALKFTERGHVQVSAMADDAKEVLTIAVADTGIGIAPQNRDLIFKPFEQEDQSESRRYEGLGLGLSISREVAVKHGGSLTVESEQGKGSTFFVSLPYKPFYKRSHRTHASREALEGKGRDGDASLAPGNEENSECSADEAGTSWSSHLQPMPEEVECLTLDSEVRREMTSLSDTFPGDCKVEHKADESFARRPTHHCPAASTAVSQQLGAPLDGSEAEELRKLRMLVQALHRQNAHLQLQVSQLHRRVCLSEPALTQLAFLKATADIAVAESEERVKHLGIDNAFYKRLGRGMQHCGPWPQA